MIGNAKVNESQLALIVALIGFLAGATQLVLKFVLGKSNRKIEENKDTREEDTTSQRRIEDLWKRIDLLENEVEIWRLKYYAEHQELNVLRARISDLENELRIIKATLEKR